MSHLNRLKAELENLSLACEYWDVRIEDSFETSIDIVDGEVVTATSSPSLGAFLRARKNGFWLYESTTELGRIRQILTELTEQDVPRGSPARYAGERQEPYLAIRSREERVSAVPLEDKLNLTRAYVSLLKEDARVISNMARYRDVYKTKSFLSSLGTAFEYDFNQCGIICAYTLKERDSLFEDMYRLYGARFGDLRNHDDELRAAIAESAKFLNAPAIAPGKYRVMMDPEVTGVFTHESFGHKSEADFMLGDKQALEDWKLGKTIGAACLNIVDFGAHEGTSGYCPIDDDGVPARKNYLIRNGVLTGRLHSVETASQLGENPSGNSRAMNFEWEPIVRMTSTYIEPGTESREALLQRCEGALVVEGVKHGSGLSTFTIAPCRGYLVGKNGERKPVRVTVLSGSVFETLKNIEAVSSDFHLKSSAIGGCGKMEQWPLPVADGGPYVLVREMQVS